MRFTLCPLFTLNIQEKKSKFPYRKIKRGKSIPPNIWSNWRIKITSFCAKGSLSDVVLLGIFFLSKLLSLSLSLNPLGKNCLLQFHQASLLVLSLCSILPSPRSCSPLRLRRPCRCSALPLFILYRPYRRPTSSRQLRDLLLKSRVASS